MSGAGEPAARAYLVESIPKGLEQLRGTPGVHYTEDVLVRLTRSARSSIDVTAMYWSLLPPEPVLVQLEGLTHRPGTLAFRRSSPLVASMRCSPT